MANRTKMSWRHDGKNTDGTPFDPALFSGWELEANGYLVLSIPVGWNTDGLYELPFADTYFNTTGDFTVRLRLVAKNGVASVWSDPVRFSQDFREPMCPFALTAD